MSWNDGWKILLEESREISMRLTEQSFKALVIGVSRIEGWSEAGNCEEDEMEFIVSFAKFCLKAHQ